MLLKELYREFPHENDGSHLDGVVVDKTIWHHHWRRLAAQSARWYAKPSVAVGRRFTDILASEWRGCSAGVGTPRDPSYLPMSLLRICWASVGPRTSGRGSPGGWTSGGRGLHAYLMGNDDAEGAAREGRAASGGEEEDESVARSYHDTVLLGKLWQAVRWETNREGGWCLFLDNKCTKTGRPVAEVLWEKHPDMRVSPRGKFYMRILRGV